SQVALPAFQSAGAEFAAVGATYLGRNTERVAIAGVAVKSRVGGNEHAFNQCAILQSPKKLLCRVTRTLLADGLERLMCVVLLEFSLQTLRQIGHCLPMRLMTDIEPFQDLVGTIARLAPVFQ